MNELSRHEPLAYHSSSAAPCFETRTELASPAMGPKPAQEPRYIRG